jgi:hypothetical protein
MQHVKVAPPEAVKENKKTPGPPTLGKFELNCCSSGPYSGFQDLHYAEVTKITKCKPTLHITHDNDPMPATG